MKGLLPKYEHRTEPVADARRYAVRLAKSGALALALVAVSLVAGMLGYHRFEGLKWIDAFLNASMLLGGMGPIDHPESFEGKVFAGVYALYCGLAVILIAGILLSPLAHRMLHKFHVEGRGQ